MLTIQELIFLTDTQRNHQTQKPWVARKAQQQHVAASRKNSFLRCQRFLRSLYSNYS